jgi:ABC-type multidrug transport system ATPase subunit
MHPSESKQGLSITRKYTFAPQPEQRGGDAAGAGERGATCQQTWLYPLDLTLQSGAVTVLLGATQAGKTSLMRIMAGLDAHQRPRARGRPGCDRPAGAQRNVAMVYQQFINYPSMTVATTSPRR